MTNAELIRSHRQMHEALCVIADRLPDIDRGTFRAFARDVVAHVDGVERDRDGLRELLVERSAKESTP